MFLTDLRYTSAMIFWFFLSSQVFAGTMAEVKTAACSDTYMTTFVRVDRAAAVPTVYGMFFHLPTLSNLNSAWPDKIAITSASPDPRFSSFSALVSDDQRVLRGTVLLAFTTDRASALTGKEEGLASFVDSNGRVNSADVTCYLTF